MMTNLRFICSLFSKLKPLVLSFIVLSLPICSFAGYLSKDVVVGATYLKDYLSSSPSNREADLQVSDYFFKVLEDPDGHFSSSVGSRALACLYFAWAEDDESRVLLEKYAENDVISGEMSFVGGAATYALKVRQHAGSTDQELRFLYAYDLGHSKNDYEKMFLANRLYNDFGKTALPVIFESSRSVSLDFVKQDLLFYLSMTSDIELANRVLTLDWGNGVEIYDWAFIMSAITPDRPSDPLMQFPFVGINKLKSLIEK